MASLYKRATPSQHFILRVVEGAVKNAQDAHPEMARIPPKFTRSIAKRATGTLTAQWPAVLAARALSKRNSSLSSIRDRSRRSAESNEPASTIIQLHKQITKRMRDLRIGEHHAVYAACQDVLRRIAEESQPEQDRAALDEGGGRTSPSPDNP